MALRYVLFDTTLFDPGDNIEMTRKNLCWMLEALTQRNQSYLSARPSTPNLYKSNVRYEVPQQFAGEVEEVSVLKKALGSAARRPEVVRVLDLMQEILGGERFRDIGRIIEKGAVDCDNLACWRAAELRQKGIKARPFMTHRKRPDGGTTYHALVLWPPIPTVPYVTAEDPSLLLGMGGADRTAERQEEIRKNIERCDILKRWKLTSPGGVSEGDVLEDVLGLRRARKAPPNVDAAVAELDRLLRGAA